MLHLGAGCDSSLWRAAGYLEPPSRAYRCILFDHRGHRGSDHPAGAKANHIDRNVEDLGTLLDELGIDAATVWGYSNGMVVGRRAAELWPGRIRTLVMSGTVRYATRAQVTEFIPPRIAEHREYGWGKLIAAFEEEKGQVPDWMRESIRATDIEPVIGWLEARPTWGWNPCDASDRDVLRLAQRPQAAEPLGATAPPDARTLWEQRPTRTRHEPGPRDATPTPVAPTA